MGRRVEEVPPISRLTIATDFSAGAALASARAALLPLGPRPRVTLVHVIPSGRQGSVRTRERADARGRLEFEADRLRKALRNAGVSEPKVRPVLAAGEPFAGILERGGKDDLLVLGRHGHRRFRDLLIGSTAERVIRAGHRPVLVVSEPARRPYRRPLVAVDLTPASRQAVEAAVRLLPPDTGLVAVHVYETAHAALLQRVAEREGVMRYLRGCRAEAEEALEAMLQGSPAVSRVERLILTRGDPRAAILKAIRSRRTDLVAVGSHGRGRLAGALVGSVAEGVVRHARCDVLVVHP